MALTKAPEVYDLAVIGGGVNGCGMPGDAAPVHPAADNGVVV